MRTGRSTAPAQPAARWRESQPAFLPRQPVGLDAIADAEFSDRFGKVIAHGALREIEMPRDLAGRLAFACQAQHLAFAIVERIGLAPGFQRQLWIDGAAAAMHLAQRLGKLFAR